jgi:hypothetical protein
MEDNEEQQEIEPHTQHNPDGLLTNMITSPTLHTTATRTASRDHQKLLSEGSSPITSLKGMIQMATEIETKFIDAPESALKDQLGHLISRFADLFMNETCDPSLVLRALTHP